MAGKAKSKKHPARNTAIPRRRVLMAPWRMNYILGPKDKGCFLCEAARLPEGDEKAWKKMLLLHKNRHGLVILNRYPYTGGHLMVVPYRQAPDLNGLMDEELADLLKLTRRCQNALQKVMKPDGFNIGLNLGKVAGAGVAGHLHIHVVPRWQGDTNFMPVLANTFVVPEALRELAAKLRAALTRD